MQRLLTLQSQHVFQALIGISRAEFATLLPAFTAAYQALRDEQRQQKTFTRQQGGGRHGVLTTPAAKLLFILFYVRQYPVQVAQGFFFGLGQPQKAGRQA